eukprot:3247302-Rhodomonas_salina.1
MSGADEYAVRCQEEEEDPEWEAAQHISNIPFDMDQVRGAICCAICYITCYATRYITCYATRYTICYPICTPFAHYMLHYLLPHLPAPRASSAGHTCRLQLHALTHRVHTAPSALTLRVCALLAADDASEPLARELALAGRVGPQPDGAAAAAERVHAPAHVPGPKQRAGHPAPQAGALRLPLPLARSRSLSSRFALCLGVPHLVPAVLSQAYPTRPALALLSWRAPLRASDARRRGVAAGRVRTVGGPGVGAAAVRAAQHAAAAAGPAAVPAP